MITGNYISRDFGTRHEAGGQDCLYCGKPMYRLTRIKKYVDGGIYTQNKTDICTNKDCPFYMDIKKIRNWQRQRGYNPKVEIHTPTFFKNYD